MLTLVLENVPPDIYDYLQRRAAERQRSVLEEALQLLRRGVQADRLADPWLPELIPSEEISAPCDLPRSSQPVQVATREGQPRLPDPPTVIPVE